MRVPRRIIVATKLTLVCLLLAAALAQASEFRRTPAGDGLATTARAPHFTVKGKVKGLYPGSSKPLKLRLTNPNDAPIAVNDSYSTVEDITLNVAAPGVDRYAGTDCDQYRRRLGRVRRHGIAAWRPGPQPRALPIELGPPPMVKVNHADTRRR